MRKAGAGRASMCACATPVCGVPSFPYPGDGLRGRPATIRPASPRWRSPPPQRARSGREDLVCAAGGDFLVTVCALAPLQEGLCAITRGRNQTRLQRYRAQRCADGRWSAGEVVVGSAMGRLTRLVVCEMQDLTRVSPQSVFMSQGRARGSRDHASSAVARCLSSLSAVPADQSASPAGRCSGP